MDQESEKNKIAVGIFDKLATMYETKFMDVSLYAESLDALCTFIPSKAPEILDLGCGPGNITKYLLAHRPDLRVLGVDLAPGMIDLAIKNNPMATFQVLDGRKVKELKHRFDAIVCGFLLPYLNKEETLQLLTDCIGQLTSNGILYLSTMEDSYEKSSWKKGSSGDELFMHYHESEYLLEALKDMGCEILHIKRYNYIHGEEPTTDLVLIARK